MNAFDIIFRKLVITREFVTMMAVPLITKGELAINIIREKLVIIMTE